MNDKNSRVERTKVMTAVVQGSLHEAFKTASRKEGKTVSQLISELMHDWLSKQGLEERDGANLASRLRLLRHQIDALPNNIHHLEAYLKMYREQGGDTGDFGNAETILEEMRPRVEEFQRREEDRGKEDCELCLDEVWFSVNRHIESDWLRFEKYILCRKEYGKLIATE